MKFNSFLNRISALSCANLMQEAHLKMLPATRKKLVQNIPSEVKKAAVLILFYPNKNNDTHFILTQRASYKGVHSAQISFPGGKKEKKDKTLKETALRETFEEIGVPTQNINCFKKLSKVYIPPSNFLVTPYLAYTTSYPKFKTNYEVTKLLEISILNLISAKSISTTNITTSYATNVKVPCFVFNNKIVWGATAMILSELKELLKLI